MIYRRKKIFSVSRSHQRGTSRFLFRFMVVVFLGAVVYILFFSSFLVVASFRISGNKNVSEDEILNLIKPKLSGKFFNVVNRNNLLLVDKVDVRKDVLERFHLLRSVEVRKKFPAELDVQVVERTPTFLFRGGNGWFVLDEKAEAYDIADPEREDMKKYNLPSLSDSDGKNVSRGDTILSQEYVGYILVLREKMKSDTDVEIEDNFETPSLVSRDIRAKAKTGFLIYFNENIALDKEIEMLNIVLRKKIEKEQLPDLEYIDLRIDNKVYYKFKEGTPEETARLAAEEAAQNPAPVIASDTEKKKRK